MKILITGSSGQVGTNLSLALMQKGGLVLGIDRRANSWTDQIPFVERDIARQGMPTFSECQAVLPAFDRPDLVVHLAANAKVHELVKDPAPGPRKYNDPPLTFWSSVVNIRSPLYSAVPGKFMANQVHLR